MSATVFLESLLGLGDAQLHHAIKLDTVYPVLLSLTGATTPDASLTRSLVHSVISRLARLGQLDVHLLVVYVSSYYVENRQLVQAVVDDAFSSSLVLRQSLTRVIPDALARELELANTSNVEGYDTLETVLKLQLVAHDHYEPSTKFELEDVLLPRLDRLYARLVRDDTDEKRDCLRLLLLSACQSLLTLPTVSLEQVDGALGTALALALDGPLVRDVERYLELSNTLTDRVQGQVGRVARGVKDSIGRLKKLAAAAADDDDDDWVRRVKQNRLGIVARLHAGGRQSDQKAGDPEEELVATMSSIHELFPHLSTEFLRIALVHPSIRSRSSGPSDNGQGQLSLPEVAENLISSLLEGDLPTELNNLLASSANGHGKIDAAASSSDRVTNGAPSDADSREARVGTKEVAMASSPTKTKTERLNIFDEDKNFAKGKLLIPGNKAKDGARGAGGKSLGHVSLDLDERLKESIIALAEAPSSDEDEDDDREGRRGDTRDTAAFLEDDPDQENAGGGAASGVRDNGDEDDSDQDNDRDRQYSGAQTPITGATTASSSSSNLFNPATVQLLEQTYLSNPGVFASDSATRRTNKQRIELRRQTGLDDNQLEGWKRMLERDAGRGGDRVDKMRERIMDLNATSNHLASPPQGGPGGGAARGNHRGGGGGGDGARGGASRGGGRGGGAGGARGGGSNRGKGDGGRAQHDRRKRGNDKKMAKMGATL